MRYHSTTTFITPTPGRSKSPKVTLAIFTSWARAEATGFIIKSYMVVQLTPSGSRGTWSQSQVSSGTRQVFIIPSAFPSTPASIESVIVQLKYPRQPVRRTEGQPLTLKCTVEYNKESCGSISVLWCLSLPENTCQPLTDPDRHLISINETIMSGKPMFRHRDAFVTFTQLSLKDIGLYQCNAVCQTTRSTAMGHLISVNVTGQDATTTTIFKGDTNDRCSVDLFLLTISIFILLWIHTL
ncbi:hypothetical protein AMELA_G00045070 [Ameiurus melas]|uniref:Ig-like domain-containing protein n=1 Tax=Ameiurus melas TaxID=219545 RepID=A0A7J6B6L9_AMEME|nr:hypothetical protein AMELA_G00045070 [Ameiurus melas]